MVWFHQVSLLWTRDILATLIAYYEWNTYVRAREALEAKPIAHLYYVLWAISNLVVRVTLTFYPKPFGIGNWIANHWFDIGITLGLLLHALGSRDMNKVWKAN